MVEGNQDKSFVEVLLKRRKIKYKNWEIKDSKGLPKMLIILETLIQSENFEVVGIMIDADTELLQHWQITIDLLHKKGYSILPKKPDLKGTIIEGTLNLPKIGVWIMPDNKTDGKLEDFITYLTPEPSKDELFKLAKETVDNMFKQGIQKISKVDKSKAILHTWLAWQEEPGLSLAQAVNARFKKRYILDDGKANDFSKWLQKLFKFK